MSHISVLKEAIKNNLDYVCIIEDDIKITYPEYVLFTINEIMKSDYPVNCPVNCAVKWDVIIIGGKIIEETEFYKGASSNKLYNKLIECQTMTGYIVNSHYYQTLLDNFTEGLNKFLRDKDDSKYAIDIYWKSLQINDLWFVPKYKYVGQYSGFSDIVSLLINYNQLNFNYFDIISNFDYLDNDNDNDNLKILILHNLNLNNYMINFIKNYPYLILNNYCYKIPSKFNKYKNKLLIKLLEKYDIIQLQFNVDLNVNLNKNNSIVCIDSVVDYNNLDLIYSDDNSRISNCILINNKVISYLLKSKINFTTLDFKKFKTCRLKEQIFLASHDKLYLDFYNDSYKNIL